jgi:hypothetical protein
MGAFSVPGCGVLFNRPNDQRVGAGLPPKKDEDVDKKSKMK